MITIPQADEERDAIISFRCSPAWKREIAKWAIDHAVSMRALAISAIAQLAGIAPEDAA